MQDMLWCLCCCSQGLIRHRCGLQLLPLRHMLLVNSLVCSALAPSCAQGLGSSSCSDIATVKHLCLHQPQTISAPVSVTRGSPCGSEMAGRPWVSDSCVGASPGMAKAVSCATHRLLSASPCCLAATANVWRLQPMSDSYLLAGIQHRQVGLCRRRRRAPALASLSPPGLLQGTAAHS